MADVFQYIAEANESGIIKLQAAKMAWEQSPPVPPQVGKAQGTTISSIRALVEVYCEIQEVVNDLFEKTILFLQKIDANFSSDDLKQAQTLLSEALSQSKSASMETRGNERQRDLDKKSWTDVLIGVLGKAGHIGTVSSFLLKNLPKWFANGQFSLPTGAQSVTSLLKDGNTLIKGLMAWSKSNKNLDKLSRMLPRQAKELRIKRLFGLTDLFAGKASQAKTSWGMRFYNNFHKLDGPLESYTKGGAKSACAWIGLGLTAVSNYLDNKEEAESGEISEGRAWAETVTETVVDVGSGWLISTAVAAGVAASIGSAPVLLVGAATVGVTMGLDWACKKITKKLTGEEKELTETISDAILDVGEAVVVGGKKVVSEVATEVSKGWNNLCDSVSRGFKPLFSF